MPKKMLGVQAFHASRPSHDGGVKFLFMIKALQNCGKFRGAYGYIEPQFLPGFGHQKSGFVTDRIVSLGGGDETDFRYLLTQRGTAADTCEQQHNHYQCYQYYAS